MFIIKCTSIFGVFITTFFIGYLLSKKYTTRTVELKQIQIALDILENKIRYTYEPIKEIFLEITKLIDGNISILFENIAKNLENQNIEESTETALKEIKINITKEDIEVLHNLSKLLGKTALVKSISEITSMLKIGESKVGDYKAAWELLAEKITPATKKFTKEMTKSQKAITLASNAAKAFKTTMIGLATAFAGFEIMKSSIESINNGKIRLIYYGD